MVAARRCIALLGALCVLATSLSVPATTHAARPESFDPEIDGSTYRPLTPDRLLDTRSPGNTALSPTQSIDLTVTGTSGVPTTGVTAVVLTLSTTDATHHSYLTAHPTGTTRPTASSLNYGPGRTTTNTIVATVGTNGQITIYNHNGTTHLVVDIHGWFGPDIINDDTDGTGSAYRPLTPDRLLDTRSPGNTALSPTQSIDLTVTGTSGVPATGVTAVVLTLSTTDATHHSYLTAHPTGTTRPTASSLNYGPGRTTTNTIVATVGTNGQITIYNHNGTTHLVVDIHGWFGPDIINDDTDGTGSAYRPLTPDRLLDTRSPGNTALGPTQSIDLTVTGTSGVPATGVTAVVLTLSTTDATHHSYLTAHPTGTTRPTASSLNYGPGRTTTNTIVATVGTNGQITIYNHNGTTHLVVDIHGWFGDQAPSTAVIEGSEVGWRFVPKQMLLAPGQTRLATLVQTGLDGLPTGSALPAGTTFEMTGSAGTVSVASLGGTTVQVTAGEVIDTAVVAAQIPDVDIAPTIAVTVANLQPGVIQIEDEDVAFPEPNLPNDGELGDLVGPDTTADGVGPFTWEEIEARIGLPDDLTGLDEGELDALEAWYPVVLRGPAPATGSLIVGTGGSALFGKIIEPDGLPTLEREGFSLVTVQLADLAEIYLDLNYELTYDDLVALGAVPPLPEPPPLPEYIEPPDPEPDPPLEPGPSRAAHQRANQQAPMEDPPPPDGSETVAGPGTLTTGGGSEQSDECGVGLKSGASGGLVTFSPAVTLTVAPKLNAYVSIVDGALMGLRFEAGGSLTLSLTAAAKLQVNAGFNVSCTLAKFAEIELAAPGPLAPFFSVIGEAAEKLTFSLTVAGGPRLEIGATCSLAVVMIAGFSYEPSTNTTTDLGAASITPNCLPVFKADLASSDGVALTATAMVGLPLSAPVSFRLGGVIAGTIGRFVSWFSAKAANLGKAKAITAAYGPDIRVTVENDTNTMAAKLATSAALAEIGGAVTVEVEPLVWLLKKFGGSSPNFSLTLYTQTPIPLVNAYQPLNVVRTEAKVEGDAAALEPAVYVQEDDDFELLATLGPTGSGVSTGLSVPELTRAKVYKLDTLDLPFESNLFDVSVVPSTGAEAGYGTTTIKLTKTISTAVCDELRDEPVEFKLVGVAPMTVFGVGPELPAWGGTFKIQCVEGKVKWNPTEVTELSFFDKTPVEVITSGPKDDVLIFQGIPGWMSVTPNSADLEGDPDLEETIEVELGVAIGGLGLCWEPRSAQLVAKTDHRGSPILKVTEEDPCLIRWKQTTVTGPGTVTAVLETRGRDVSTLNISGLPSWATIDPQGPIQLASTGGEIEEIEFTIEIDERERSCAPQLAENATLTASTSFRGTAQLQLLMPKVDPYTDCGLRFTPNALTGTGSSQLTLRDDELKDDTATWEIDPAQLPEWLGVLPESGSVSTAAPATVGFAVLPTPFDPCVGRPTRVATVTAVATFDVVLPGIAFTRTKEAQLTVTDPAVPPINCPKTTGGAKGDPHMWSMDGVSFEGQIIGEYIYNRSPAGSAHPFELVVRTVPTGGSAGSVAPTSVQAIALTFDDHTVEVYGGSPSEVLVDGELIALDDGAPLEVTTGLSVVRTGDTVRIDLPNITIVASAWSTLLDITVSAAVGSPMEGLLGSPDGNPANDFVGADGTAYTVAQVQGNVVPQFFEFVTSWRITDPDESPFTRVSAHFATPNPGFSQEILDEFGPLVEDALDGSADICSGSLTDKQFYGLALELSIGTDPTDLERYICAYAVSGTALSDGEPTAGLQVTTDAEGLHPCVTTTGIDGRFFCSMVVDLVEVSAAAGPVLPLEVDVVGNWPGLASVAASNVATFPTAAAIDAGAQMATADLEVDPDSVPRVVVSGTMTRDDVPLAGPRAIQLVAYDDGDSVLLQTTLNTAVDVDDGSYAVVRVLPPTATRITLSTTVPTPVVEVFTTEATTLALGANPITFDVVYDVPTVTVQGTISDGTDPIAGPHTMRIVPRTAGDIGLPLVELDVTPDADTGAYTVTVPLPRTAASATATILLAPYLEPFTSALTPLVDAAATIDLDVTALRPVFRVSGAATAEDGGPLPASTMQITFRDAGGATLALSFASLPTTPGATTHLVERTGPLGAVTAEAGIAVGTSGESFTTGPVALVPGLNEVELDIMLTPVRLTVSGIMSDGVGDPLPGPVPATVYFYDAGDGLLGSHGLNITPDAETGLYSATFTGHRDAVSALVRVTPTPGDDFEKSVTGLVRGDNATTFDVGFNPPAVNVFGRMTGPDGGPLAPTVLVKFSGYREDGSGFSRSAVATLDAEGDYSVTVVFPLATVEVEAWVEVGPAVDWFRTDRVPVVAGTNPLPLDIDYRPPVLTVSGTMVSAPGVGLAAPFVPGPVPLGITSFDENDTLIGYTQPNITPAADGTYSTTHTLPRRTARVEARAFISGEDLTADLDGIVTGATPTLDFDVAYHPARVDLQGTALVDGIAATSIQVELRRFTSPTTSAVSYLTIPVAPDGTFNQQDVLLNLDTTAFTATLRAAGGLPHEQSAAVVEQGGQYTLTYDIDDTSTTLELSGTFRIYGEPSAATYVEARGYDSGGAPVGQVVTENVTPDSGDGSYSLTFQLPADAASVSLSTALSSPTTFDSQYHATDVGLVPSDVNLYNWSIDSTLLRVSGTLVDAGVHVEVPDSELRFEVAWDDGGLGTEVAEAFSYYDPFDHSFQFEVVLPAQVAEVQVRLATADLPQPAFTVDGISPGIIDRTWDIDLDTFVGTSLFVSGQFTDGGFPLPFLGDPYGVSVEVIGYEYVDMDTPLVEVFRESAFGILDPDDSTYLFGFDLPETATLAKIVVDDGNDGWIRTVLLVPGVENAYDFDIELGVSRLRYSGNTILDGCAGPLLFEREFWVFTEEPTGGYDWNTETWPGGVLVGRFLIAPDVAPDHRHDIAMHIPADTVWIGSIYRDHNSAGEGSFSISPNSLVGVGADETHHC